MTTKTMRVYPEDEQRARLLATVHGESNAEFIHRVLTFWVENNHDAAGELFRRAQDAVLSGDRDQLRAVFREGVDAAVDEDMAHLDRVGR